MADETGPGGLFFGFNRHQDEDMTVVHKCNAGPLCVYAGKPIATHMEPRMPYAWLSRSPEAQAPDHARRYHVACASILAINAAASPVDAAEESTEERHTRVLRSDDLVNREFDGFCDTFPEGSLHRELLAKYYSFLIMRSQTGKNFDAGTRGTVRRTWPRFAELAPIDFSNKKLLQQAAKAAPAAAAEEADIRMSQ